MAQIQKKPSTAGKVKDTRTPAQIKRADKKMDDGLQDVKEPRFDPKSHWKGMPEFNQPEGGPMKALIVNFENMEDVHKFSKLIGQPITAKTKFVWYPGVPIEGAIDKRWSDKAKKK